MSDVPTAGGAEPLRHNEANGATADRLFHERGLVLMHLLGWYREALELVERLGL